MRAGIFVADIIEAVPIDKYFELFKPNLLGSGGFIRICMNFVKDLKELQQPGACIHECVCACEQPYEHFVWRRKRAQPCASMQQWWPAAVPVRSACTEA